MGYALSPGSARSRAQQRAPRETGFTFYLVVSRNVWSEQPSAAGLAWNVAYR